MDLLGIPGLRWSLSLIAAFRGKSSLGPVPTWTECCRTIKEVPMDEQIEAFRAVVL